jgi:hypothetical protein
MAAESLRAHYIRPGDAAERVRYEVDRIRSGRSFRHPTRRRPPGDRGDPQPRSVVPARRSVGEVSAIAMPVVPPPDELDEASWSDDFVRRFVPESAIGSGTAVLSGRAGRRRGSRSARRYPTR